MKTIQLSDTLFCDVADGDLFVYIYPEESRTNIALRCVENDVVPPIDEFTVEILSFYSRRHFLFTRDGPAYWWYETKF